MQLGVLNKIDQDLKNSRNNTNSKSTSDDNFEENNDVKFTKNFVNQPPKEYKASTLDWLGGRAII
ncbi:MAG: hypothetical protein CMN37_05995 [SAR116 cluster bacterium]|nr:hypothetical protein [SAR116 cluster bacterium]